MRAFLLAAGYGTRLQPLTNDRPKALVEVCGVPMIEFPLTYLKSIGIREITVNVHYRSDQMIEYLLRTRKEDELSIRIQDESDMLLNSGGALARVKKWLFEKHDTAIYLNGDALYCPDFDKLWAFHKKHLKVGCEITMPLIRHLDIGHKFLGVSVKGNRVSQFDQKDPQKDFHWPSIQLIEKRAAARVEDKGEPFSIKILWNELAAEQKIAAFINEYFYQDIGDARDFDLAESRLQKGDFPLFNRLIQNP